MDDSDFNDLLFGDLGTQLYPSDTLLDDSDDDIPLAKLIQGTDSDPSADEIQNNNKPDNLSSPQFLTEQLKDPYLHKIYLHL